MNNGVNPNEKNNLNGQVLGENPNTNPINSEMETLETLDTPSSSVVMDNSVGTTPSNNSALSESSVMLNEPTPSNIDNSNNYHAQPNTVTPEPAYTNLQSINPMPGFESPGTIGTTPPMSFEPDEQPKKKKTSKTFFVICIILVLFGIGFGTYYVLKYTDLLNSAPKIEIETKTLEVNMGDRLSPNISDYASITGTDTRNCNLNIEDVNINEEGTYHYQVTCGEIHKKGVIKVVDNTELVVETKKVYKVKGELVNANEFIKNINSSYSYEFVNREEVENYLKANGGNYTIKIKATYGAKTVEVDAVLVVLQHKIKGDLVCKSNEQNVLNSSAVMTVENTFAIANDGNNGYGGIATEKYVFKFTDETKYADYVAEYNTKGNITINNISGDTEFDNAKLTITISNEIQESEMNDYKGDDNLITYRSIRLYFIDTLGYTCSYNLK